MILEIIANMMLSIRNLLRKDLAKKIDVQTVTGLAFLLGGFVGLAFVPHYVKTLKQTSATTWLKVGIHSILSLVVSFLITYCFSISKDVSVTSALMCLNIVTTFILDCILQKRLVGTPTKWIGITAVFCGALLSNV